MTSGTATTSQHTSQHTSRRSAAILAAALLDVLVVFVFVAIGRGSHAEGITVPGILSTAWPFLAGAAIGWAAGRPWRDPLRLRIPDVAVWLGALVCGMVLRVLAGQGTQLSFVLVAGTFLALFLLGWRGIGTLVARARSRKAGS